MAYSTNVWNQLRNLSVDSIISALLRDGWQEESKKKVVATRAFIKAIDGYNARVVIHYHSGKTYGAKFLKGILEDIGWTEEDLRRLKIIK